MSTLGIPVDIEKSEISSSLNASVLFFFLVGMCELLTDARFQTLNDFWQECTL
jgi:hypothetical protein